VAARDPVKRETFDLLLGLGVMALGIGLLLFTFGNALALAANPGQFIRSQVPSTQQQVQGPSASFTWSSDGFNLTVQDTSHAGSGSLTNWQWDFGDNSGQVTGQHPSVHVYANAGPYTVLLTVTDSNGQGSTTFSPVDIVPAQSRSGQSVGDLTASIPNLNFNLGDILLPVGVGLLTVGLYLAMAVIGGAITKAGWNLVRPRPETIRIRLKPEHLQQMMEADAAPQAAPPPPPPQSEA
jgi:PKD domain-containing protein